jgi:putative ABC transport system permease protein
MRLLVRIIRAVTPEAHREFVVGDTIERATEIERVSGKRAASRWLWREMWRVIVRAPGHRLAVRVTRLSRGAQREKLFGSSWYDVRYTLRGFKRTPGTTAIIVLTLALGIGATTAIFTVVYDVLIKPLSYPDADELVTLRLTRPEHELGDPPGVVDSMYFTLREQSRALEQVGLWSERDLTLIGSGDPERVPGIAITDGALQALNVQPALGRSFLDDEYTFGSQGPRPVILSYGYWQRRFGGSESVLGQNLSVDNIPSQVVGVMPASFRFLDLNPQPNVISPLRIDRDPTETFILFLNGFARLRDGVTLEQANADLARILPIWLENGPPAELQSRVAEWGFAPALRPLKDDVVGGVTGMLWLLLGAVGAVLLIACANIANLVLVRADERSHEFAIRKALGAGRRHIAGDLFLDSLVLGALGGVTGVVLALGGLNLLARIAPTNLPRIDEIAVGAPEVVFAIAMVLVASLLFGMLPAVKHASASEAPLGARARGPSGGAERNRTRNVLIVVQISLALMLLVGAGLMLRTFQALSAVDPGFSGPESVQLATISVPRSIAPDEQSLIALQRRILDRIESLPGVTTAGFSRGVPLARPLSWSRLFADGVNEGDEPLEPLVAYISPGYLEALGTRLIAGRHVTWADIEQDRNKLLVSESVARDFWGDPEAAIGKRVGWAPEGRTSNEIVGVVQDTRELGLNQAPPAIVYRPFLRELRLITFVARSDRAGTESLANEMRQAIWGGDPALAVFDLRTMESVYSDWLAQTSFVLTLLSIAGGMALVLSVVGVYGVVSYIVSRRSREIGIRLAFGAQSQAVQRMFLKRSLQVATIGLAIGLVASMAFGRWMGSLLYVVRPLDPATYLLVFGLLLAAVALATYLPARRAARLDPAMTLRAE